MTLSHRSCVFSSSITTLHHSRVWSFLSWLLLPLLYPRAYLSSKTRVACLPIFGALTSLSTCLLLATHDPCIWRWLQHPSDFAFIGRLRADDRRVQVVQRRVPHHIIRLCWSEASLRSTQGSPLGALRWITPQHLVLSLMTPVLPIFWDKRFWG